MKYLLAICLTACAEAPLEGMSLEIYTGDGKLIPDGGDAVVYAGFPAAFKVRIAKDTGAFEAVPELFVPHTSTLYPSTSADVIFRPGMLVSDDVATAEMSIAANANGAGRLPICAQDEGLRASVRQGGCVSINVKLAEQ